MFKIEHKVEENLIIYPIGELDIYTTDQFKQEAISLYSENKKDILMNLEKLEYIDSTGLGAFIYILNNISENNNKLIIENVKPSIRKLFSITKLDEIFEMRD